MVKKLLLILILLQSKVFAQTHNTLEPICLECQNKIELNINKETQILPCTCNNKKKKDKKFSFWIYPTFNEDTFDISGVKANIKFNLK